MQLWLQDKLPFTTVRIAYKSSAIDIPNVLIDTGSAGTIMAADIIAAIQIIPLPQDTLRVIRGVGGSEAVFIRRVDYLQVGECSLPDFEIEVGGMDYGFEISRRHTPVPSSGATGQARTHKVSVSQSIRKFASSSSCKCQETRSLNAHLENHFLSYFQKQV